MYQVIGKQRVDYVSKEKKEVKGLKLWLAYEKKGVEGFAAETVYLSDAKLQQIGLTVSDINIDDTVNVLYNRYGNVESVSVVSK